MVMTITDKIRDNKNIDMSETLFWCLVEAINWETVSRQQRGYEVVSKRLGEELTIKEATDLRAIASIAVGLLDKVIDERNPARGGDDSHSDFCTHIIGLGSAVFYSSLGDYDLMAERGRRSDYAESFSYCLPYPSEMEMERLSLYDVAFDIVEKHNHSMYANSFEEAKEKFIEQYASEDVRNIKVSLNAVALMETE